jgi:glycosyltransferase involved in cell wall biosynthesis
MEEKTTRPKKRILFIAPFKAPFINTDIEILGEFAHIKPLIKNGFRAIFSILWYAPSCDLICCWFGSVYGAVASLYAKIINKPCIIIIGGVDAAAIPEMNYGIWLNAWKASLVTQGLRNATLNLVVAPSLKERLMQLANYDGRNIEHLPTGYDTDFWKPGKKKEKMVLTVAESDTETRLKIKGIDYLLSAAGRLPEIPFVIIGVEKDLLEACGLSVPENVELLPAMKREELLAYYQRSVIYCQPSRSEGMPNTLCEAMACGCVPVGSDIPGIALAIGDTGFVAPLGDIDALAAEIKKAIQLAEEHGLKARERIISQFPKQRRIDGLRKVIDSLTSARDN